MTKSAPAPALRSGDEKKQQRKELRENGLWKDASATNSPALLLAVVREKLNLPTWKKGKGRWALDAPSNKLAS